MIEKDNIGNEPERAVIAGLAADSMDIRERSTEESLDELEALLETAGGVCIGRVLQNRKTPEPRTFIGDGKVKELKALAEDNECTLAVFDNELSPSQMRALAEDLDLRVIDRSSLILDIFAGRARTREGRLQVELAQYKYLLPRLTGMWKHLTSQTGTSAPIGTRGPGETQLESDRRHIRRKIAKLEEELDEVIRTRDTQRRLREKNSVPVVALVGYTNAGKSTLLNTLTGAGIQAENRLFDTLDTTTRRFDVSDTMEALISDTVGFIRKLPHHLVEAFKATLEELKYADLLVHVIDASHPEWQEQARIVNELIEELGASQTPRIEAYNKCDILSDDVRFSGEMAVEISAKTGQGIGKLLAVVEEALAAQKKSVTIRLPYDKAGMVDALHRECSVTDTRYLDEYIEVDAVVGAAQYGKYRTLMAQNDGGLRAE
ncbi:MAG: GTPase HflX [Oscillospiraceae bacterium]|nr:GTPase HflX [Oscillospiraceae bacterium]